MDRIRIVIGGGGTGGHVFPALAIADALAEKMPGTEILFVGARGKLEMEKVPAAGYPIRGLPVSGFHRGLSLKNLAFFFRLAASMFLSRRIIRQFRPQVAVGVGGYASGPILRAAARKGIPLLIQEQNSYAGVTNRLLARSASTICVAYKGMERYFPAGRLVLTGNPIRKSLMPGSRSPEEDRVGMGLKPGLPTCLVVGGSLGARTLNRSILGGMEKLTSAGVQVIWQCGKHYFDEIRDAVKSDLFAVMPFISEMEVAYSAADVIVSRAGAITLSELCVVGKPAILVPSPNVAEDHQRHNAEALVSESAALMVPDREAEQRLVDTLLELLNDRPRQQLLAESIRKLKRTDASERIAEEVLKLIPCKP